MPLPAAPTHHQIRLARRTVGIRVPSGLSFKAGPALPPEPCGSIVTPLQSLDMGEDFGELLLPVAQGHG